MGWAVDCGVLHAGSDGLAVRPQMKLALKTNTYKLQAGLDDLRDGLSAAFVAQVQRTYYAEGSSLAEVLQTLKVKDSKRFKFFDKLIKWAPWLLGQICKVTHVDIPKGSRLTAKTIVKTGLGVDGAVHLGWADTKGFHMIGLKGKVGVLAKVGGNLIAGLHHTRRKVKAVVGYGNAVLEIEFHLPEKASTGTPGEPDEYVPPRRVPQAPPQDILEPPAESTNGAYTPDSSARSAAASKQRAMADAADKAGL